jgi:hypothetical protein
MNVIDPADRGHDRNGQQTGEGSMIGWLGVVVPALTGALFVAIGAPLARRRIPRNRWYGYRTGLTLQDDAIWYAVNERGGRHLIVLGGSLIAVGLIGLFFTGNDDTQRDLLILALAVTAAGLAFSIRSCHLLARAMERTRRMSEALGVRR